MSWSTYNTQGQLIEHGDDVAQTVTEFNPANGQVISTTPYTAAQIAAANAEATGQTAQTNYQAILTAIATQRANNTAFLALASPLTLTQIETQVRALTRQNNALMRLAANDLTGTN